MNPYLLVYIIFVALLLIWYWSKNNKKNHTGPANTEFDKAPEGQNESEDRQTDDYEEDGEAESDEARSYAGGDLAEDKEETPEEEEKEEDSGQAGNQPNDTAIVIFQHQPRANTWICENCEIMNNDDFPYCFVCGTPKE